MWHVALQGFKKEQKPTYVHYMHSCFSASCLNSLSAPRNQTQTVSTPDQWSCSDFELLQPASILKQLKILTNMEPNTTFPYRKPL